MERSELMRRAYEVCGNAYAPYSHFKVGAALLCKSGRVYVGCNVENASYGATVCAERAAVVNAIAGGEREFLQIAVVCADGREVLPCGICRQFLSEFGEIEVITEGGIYSADDLLKHAFHLNRE